MASRRNPEIAQIRRQLKSQLLQFLAGQPVLRRGEDDPCDALGAFRFDPQAIGDALQHPIASHDLGFLPALDGADVKQLSQGRWDGREEAASLLSRDAQEQRAKDGARDIARGDRGA
jgi:hypothetical protein